MAVNDTTPSVQYTATASQTTFAYPFEIFEDADLKVYQVSSSGTPDDTTDLLTLTTHYTVTGAGVDTGGDIVLVTGATSGDVITIKRDLAVKRTTDYQNLGDLASESFNDDLDKLVMMTQQNEEAFGRAISLQESTQTPTTFNIDDPVAEYYAVAKADLSGIKWLQLLSAGDLSVSAFMQTVLDDSTAGEALTTLGITAFAQTILDDTTAAEARTTLGASAATNDVYRGVAAGAADVITVAATPTLAALTDGTVLFVTALLANATTTPTLNVDSLGAKTITREGNQALLVGDIARVDHELILRYDAGNTVWELLNPAPHKFRGCIAYLTVDESTANLVSEDLGLAGEIYDTDSIHDNATNNSRLTVPAGVTRVRLIGQVEYAANATGYRKAFIRKGGVLFPGAPLSYIMAAPTGATLVQVSSPVLTVSASEYFELGVQQSSGGALNVTSGDENTWFAMEIIE